MAVLLKLALVVIVLVVLVVVVVDVLHKREICYFCDNTVSSALNGFVQLSVVQSDPEPRRRFSFR